MNGTQEEQTSPRDAAHWAGPVSKLKVTDVPSGAVSLNVEGRQVVGPLQGFGQLWQNTYWVRLSNVDATPEDVISLLKEKLPDFMPDNSRFYPSVTGLEPGELILINATLPGVPGTMATGVMVLYSDAESFTVMCPDGHPRSGWNTFSAFDEGGTTVAQIQSLDRSSDPIFEIGLRFMGGSKQQHQLWVHVLGRLAAHYGIDGQVRARKTLVDSRLQWSEAKNVWYNSIIRSVLNLPVRTSRRMLKRGSPE